MLRAAVIPSMIPVPVGKGRGKSGRGPSVDMKLPVGRMGLTGIRPVLPISGVVVDSNGARRDGMSPPSRS